MESIKSTPPVGKIHGIIDCTSQKGKTFEIEVCTKDNSKYLVTISDTHMYILNRAIEYIGSLPGMEVNVEFDFQRIEIFVIKGVSIVLAFSSAKCVSEGIA